MGKYRKGILWGSVNEPGHLENPATDERIILK
jgi:hypothetical protein